MKDTSKVTVQCMGPNRQQPKRSLSGSKTGAWYIKDDRGERVNCRRTKSFPKYKSQMCTQRKFLAMIL